MIVSQKYELSSKLSLYNHVLYAFPYKFNLLPLCAFLRVVERELNSQKIQVRFKILIEQQNVEIDFISMYKTNVAKFYFHFLNFCNMKSIYIFRGGSRNFKTGGGGAVPAR